MARRTLRQISAADLEHLEIDDRTRQLYWYGERVRSQIALTGWQTTVAVIGALAGVATIVTGLNNGTILVCSRGWHFPLLGCPAAADPAPPANPAVR